ncbi:unnamed protein product [Symbiodinium sp. KB8]|nr:unnamed protein product [Symbiodinium sp. KB8]
MPGKDLIVMLYVGKDDDSVLHAVRPDLTDKFVVEVDDESVLVLRQMLITSLACLGKPASFLEHPEDPAKSGATRETRPARTAGRRERGVGFDAGFIAGSSVEGMQVTQTGINYPSKVAYRVSWTWKSQRGRRQEDSPPPPQGWENYPSAEKFQESIKATFLEEVPMKMVEGPLAGIEESDKIRTIYDGSRSPRREVAKLGTEWWVNKVGTYGMASAQLYWGRLDSSAEMATAIMPVLLSLGTPLSWKKTLMAEINTWLGFVIDPSVPSVQLAKDKFLLVMKILEDLEEGKVFTSKAIEKALGRIQWATTCCPATKSLMQPLWAWKQACITSGKPGKVIQALASLLKRLFEEPHAQISPFVSTSSWWGASDAGADDFKAHIGGWITNSKTSHRSGPILIPVLSDNQGNVYSLLDGKSRKLPSAALLMELMLLIHRQGCLLAPSHVKRDLNQWADSLTRSGFTGFTPDKPGGTIKAVPPPAFPQLRPRPSDPGAGSYAPTGSVTSEAALEEQLQAQARVAIMQLQSQDPEYDADPLLAPAQAAPKPPPDPVIMQGEIMSLVQKFGLDERIRVRLVDALTRRAATFWEVPAFDSESYVDCTKSSGIVVREAH